MKTTSFGARSKPHLPFQARVAYPSIIPFTPVSRSFDITNCFADDFGALDRALGAAKRQNEELEAVMECQESEGNTLNPLKPSPTMLCQARVQELLRAGLGITWAYRGRKCACVPRSLGRCDHKRSISRKLALWSLRELSFTNYFLGSSMGATKACGLKRPQIKGFKGRRGGRGGGSPLAGLPPPPPPLEGHACMHRRL